MAAVLAPLITQWQRRVSSLSELIDPEMVKLLAPGEPESEPGLTAALDRLALALRAVPGPPQALPATAEEVSDAARALSTVEQGEQEVVRAMADAVSLAIATWDTRVAAATSLAQASRRLLPYTGDQRKELEGRLDEASRGVPPRPALPVESPAAIDAAVDAFSEVAALEKAARAVLAATAAAEGPLSLVRASTYLQDAARAMLPFAGEQRHDLADRLGEAARQLRDATPGWWDPDGARLATVADVEAAEQGLEGDEADLVRAAAEDFENAVADVAAAANRTGERLHRLRELARRLAPAVPRQHPDAEPGSLRAHAALAPLEYGVRVPHPDEGTAPLDGLTIVRDWPGLRAGTGVDAPEVAADTAIAVAERAQRQPSVQRAQDVIRNVFATAVDVWRPRRIAALRLAERVRELLPETGERRDELTDNLDRTYRAVSAAAIAAQLETIEQLEAAGPALVAVATRTALLESAIGAVLRVTIDGPIRQLAGSVEDLATETLLVLPYTREHEVVLGQRLAQAQPGLVLPPLLAPQAARQESVTEVSSARMTLQRLTDSLPAFTAVVTTVLQAGLRSRVTAVRSLGGQARELLETAGGRLANGLGRRLARELAAAEDELSRQLPVLSATPPAADLDAVRWALASVTAVETAARAVLTGVRDVLVPRVAAALDLADAATRALLPYIAAEHAALGTVLESAERDLRAVPELPAQPSATAEQMDAARRGLARLGELENATARLLIAATAGHDELRPRVDVAQRAARAARAALPHAGDRQGQLDGQLTAAVADLLGSTPAWWTATGTALETVPQIEAASPGLNAGRAEFLDAVQQVEGAIGQVFAAAAQGLERTIGRLRTAASELAELLPLAGGRQVALDTAVREALQRVTAVPADTWAVMAQGSHGPPELEAAITTMDVLSDLEAAIEEVNNAVSDATRQRADALLRLAGPVRHLLPHTAPEVFLGSRLDTAERTVGDLLGRPARHLLGPVDDLHQSIEAVLTEAARGFADRIATASAVFAGMGMDLPVTDAQRHDLTALEGSLQDPGAVVAALPDPAAAVAAVRQGLLALTALERAASDALDPGPLTARSQAALALARAARNLPVTSETHADQHQVLVSAIRAVRPALGELSRLQRPGTAAEARTSGHLVSAVLAQVADLETAVRQVIAAATDELDGLRPETEAARIVAEAARGLLRRTGTHRDGLTASLDQAVDGLLEASPRWWPAAGAELTTVAQLEAVALALPGAPERIRQATQDVGEAVAAVLAAANEVMRDWAHAVTARAEVVRRMLPYTGGQQDALTAELGAAVARLASIRATQPRQETLAGVEAAGRDFYRLADAAADVGKVFGRVTAGIKERLDAAPALARAARELLPRVGNAQALTDALGAAEQALFALRRPSATRPATPGPLGLLRPRPDLAQGTDGPGVRGAAASVEEQLRAVTELEAASRDVLTAATARLDRRWQRLDAARRRAAAARVPAAAPMARGRLS